MNKTIPREQLKQLKNGVVYKVQGVTPDWSNSPGTFFQEKKLWSLTALQGASNESGLLLDPAAVFR